MATTTADGAARVPPRTQGARAVRDGTTLDVGTPVRLADGRAVPVVPPEARERAVRSRRTAPRSAAPASARVRRVPRTG
ncbi:hypothetical protein [Streptomyces sp. ALI-76-A]|uniref:hypothetical protein n=1 Tax=Streptomyces sp. ALI-76-A TaxID=3025736 RepID=UPI00256F3EEA|nr:hypothetical protein [Streptomyces sp. ALI-76-A]MDL5204435.1 hypothetical protein [Streptomyces sp. ALI-76-A]